MKAAFTPRFRGSTFRGYQNLNCTAGRQRVENNVLPLILAKTHRKHLCSEGHSIPSTIVPGTGCKPLTRLVSLTSQSSSGYEACLSTEAQDQDGARQTDGLAFGSKVSKSYLLPIHSSICRRNRAYYGLYSSLSQFQKWQVIDRIPTLDSTQSTHIRFDANSPPSYIVCHCGEQC